MKTPGLLRGRLQRSRGGGGAEESVLCVPPQSPKYWLKICFTSMMAELHVCGFTEKEPN